MRRSGLSVIFWCSLLTLSVSAEDPEVTVSATTTSTTTTESSDRAPQLASLISTLRLPPGFNISLFHSDVPNARSLTRNNDGTIVYVGSNAIFHGSSGCYDCIVGETVFALVDSDRDGVAEERVTVATSLNNPNGVAYHQGDLYVAEISRILRFPDIDSTFRDKPEYIVIDVTFPSKLHHGWKYIAFSPPPESLLYVPVGAPCNICEEDFPFSGITTVNVTNPHPTIEPFASGIRNSVGFDWHPETGELWFTENGRDNWGNDIPPDELNRAHRKGLNFGFPYCYGNQLVDSTYNTKGDCEGFEPAAQDLDPHVAAIGMRFYRGHMFPKEYRHQVFIAEHGSWNRDVPIGYRITLVRLHNDTTPASYDVFVDGWLDNKSGEAWGRPTDLLETWDDSVLIADDKLGVVYRLSYPPSPSLSVGRSAAIMAVVGALGVVVASVLVIRLLTNSKDVAASDTQPLD